MMKLNKIKALAAVVGLGLIIAVAGCGSSSGDSNKKVAQEKNAKTYVVATRGTFRPFTYKDDKGNLTGYDIEVIREVAKRNPDIKLEFKLMSPSAGFIAMESGQVDIIANQITYNPKRAEKTIFTKEVNNYTSRKLAVRSDNNDIKSLEDLKGKKVVVTGSSEVARQLQELNKKLNPPIELIYTDKGFTDNVNIVITGRADATPQYEVTINDGVKALGLKIKAVGEVIASDPTYFALRKDEEHQKLADKIDKSLKEMRADGTLKKLSEQFLLKDYTVPQKK